MFNRLCPNVIRFQTITAERMVEMTNDYVYKI